MARMKMGRNFLVVKCCGCGLRHLIFIYENKKGTVELEFVRLRDDTILEVLVGGRKRKLKDNEPK